MIDKKTLILVAIIMFIFGTIFKDRNQTVVAQGLIMLALSVKLRR